LLSGKVHFGLDLEVDGLIQEGHNNNTTQPGRNRTCQLMRTSGCYKTNFNQKMEIFHSRPPE
jgi:hypothetical protein